MYRVALTSEDDFAGWREAARALALAEVPADQVQWQIGEAEDLFADESAAMAPPEPKPGAEFSVPRQFVTLAEQVMPHPDPQRFAMLYDLLVRVRGNARLIMDQGDPLVRRLNAMALESRLEALAGRNDKTAALAELREEAGECRRCPLYRGATQIVFGEGAASAKLMLIGEQPGDQEDLAGRPFVGPAGQMLDKALGEAGIDRAETFVTNAVKHFRFEQRGKRRIHQTPDSGHIEACRWWFAQERALLRPPVTVALGGSAAHALLGRKVTIGRTRGQPIALDDGLTGWVTVHPSYLLRIPDEGRKREEYALFVEDLKGAHKRAAELA